MICVKPVVDSSLLVDILSKSGVAPAPDIGAVCAFNSDEIIGYCVYSLNETSITVKYLFPTNDFMLADGILRSALHVADFRGISKAYYSETAPLSVFEKLGFIRDSAEKTLKIEKLHESCCKNCK